MVSAIHTCTTKACNQVQSLLNDGKKVKSEGLSRLAGPFVAVPLLVDAVANVVVGVAKAVWAAVTKVIELGLAFFGKDYNFGNFACEASNHFGKALAGVLATPFTIVLGFVVPSAALKMLCGLGLAAAPVKAEVVAEQEEEEVVSQKQSQHEHESKVSQRQSLASQKSVSIVAAEKQASVAELKASMVEQPREPSTASVGG